MRKLPGYVKTVCVVLTLYTVLIVVNYLLHAGELARTFIISSLQKRIHSKTS